MKGGNQMEIPKESMIGPSNPYEISGQKKSNGDMTIDDFMKIMAATISNPSMSEEDSGNPQDYMMQMATFTQMEQMSAMTDVLSSTMLMIQQQQAISLSGKTVTVWSEEAGKVEGTVERVRFANGFATIQVDGKEYNLNDVLEVGEPAE